MLRDGSSCCCHQSAQVAANTEQPVSSLTAIILLPPCVLGTDPKTDSKCTCLGRAAVSESCRGNEDTRRGTSTSTKGYDPATLGEPMCQGDRGPDPEELEKDGSWAAEVQRATTSTGLMVPKGRRKERRVLSATSTTTKVHLAEGQPRPRAVGAGSRAPKSSQSPTPARLRPGLLPGGAWQGSPPANEGRAPHTSGKPAAAGPSRLRRPPGPCGGSEPARPPLPAPQEPTTPAEAAVPPTAPCLYRPALREGPAEAPP